MGFEGHRSVDERLEDGQQPVIARWLGIAEQERKDQAGLDELRQRVAHRCPIAPPHAAAWMRSGALVGSPINLRTASRAAGRERTRSRSGWTYSLLACSGGARVMGSAIVCAIAAEVKS
jgi:hypothetical protein